MSLPATTLLPHRSPRTELTWEGIEVARDLGSIEVRGRKARVQIKRGEERYSLGKFPIGPDVWLPMTPEIAERVLQEVRNRYASRPDDPHALAYAVAPFLESPSAATLVLSKMEAFRAREEQRLASGDIKPRTYRELARYLRPDGEFTYWHDWHVQAVSYGALEDWQAWLATERGLGPKTIRNVMGELRRCLRWLARRGDLQAVPEFPTVKVQRDLPEVLTAAEVARVMEAIPWEERGIYLALYHAIRPSEARALDLIHWRDPRIVITQAMEGSEAGASIGTVKTRQARLVGADDELAGWIRWRLERATAEERLRRQGVPLFPTRRGGRWSQWALGDRWRTAVKAAGVAYVSPYKLKHSAATDLAVHYPLKVLQSFLGHADARSVDHYLALAGETVQDLKRGR